MDARLAARCVDTLMNVKTAIITFQERYPVQLSS